MRRDLVFRGAARQVWRPASSIACLAFVALLAVAFWAGAAWLVQLFLRLNASSL